MTLGPWKGPFSLRRINGWQPYGCGHRVLKVETGLRLRMGQLAFVLLITAAMARSSGELHAQTIEVIPPPAYSYELHTVKQQKVRGGYGRYITFIGTTIHTWPGSPGRPGDIQCSEKKGQITCSLVGYVAPVPAGSVNRSYVYELDCKDLTFDRKGDRTPSGTEGWLNVDDDPTASAVAKKFCPTIQDLPKQEV